MWLAISQNPKGGGDIITLAFEEHKAQIKFDIVSPLFLCLRWISAYPSHNSAATITLQSGAKQDLRNGLQGVLLGSC